MRHLIVEACIARNLLDTSAYLWPGYVNGRINQLPQCLPAQVPGWSSFMKGAALTPVMVNALVSSPASRYVLYISYDLDCVALRSGCNIKPQCTTAEYLLLVEVSSY